MSFLISSFLGSNPSARRATFSSLASMLPDPSVSNRSKALERECVCSYESFAGRQSVPLV